MDPRSSLYPTSMTSASLGPGSALGEKGKNRRSLGRGKGGPDIRWARFAHRYFSYLTPFFSFFPHCGAWSLASHLHKNETKGNENESKEVQFPAAEMPLIQYIGLAQIGSRP